MIPTTIKTDPISSQTQAKSVAAVKPIVPVAPVATGSDSKHASHEFVQGQKYQALVEAQLSNGNFRVLISDKLLQMHLPENIRPGDKLELVLLSNMPKLKFALEHQSLGETTKNNTSISATGRFLDVLTQESGKSAASNILTSTHPILTDSPLNSRELSLLLQKAIHQSGLFYESHLAKWLKGKNTVEKLQQEPQGKISTTTSTAASDSMSVIPVNTQSLSLVQQQLLALETGHIAWNGEIWKGQDLQWDIYEDTTNKNIADDNTALRWKTTLTLTLPQLGKIIASITFNSQGTQISIDIADDTTVNLLKTEIIHFKVNMQAAGITVQSLDIHHND
ncbi:flagellar hook-length control protein FliK [Nitrosomonas aestuarii]|uniref:flagellar hook-length control protein FliK n=1 Tax=Nitrosomonas aestuarii TaxID=52441 RepID=UPI000D313AE5|nr:flagellar hook-length control protein FliK [Nitrosomonas aestuarii]PTN13132.1 flagellar hook-length control protein FliK [Nitrosomonas aestuarii]